MKGRSIALPVTHETIEQYCEIYFSQYTLAGQILAKESYLQKLFFKVPIDDIASQQVICEELQKVNEAKMLLSHKELNKDVRKKSQKYGRHFS